MQTVMVVKEVVMLMTIVVTHPPAHSLTHSLTAFALIFKAR